MTLEQTRVETLISLRAHRVGLSDRLLALQKEADAAAGAIRMYRTQRVQQFRDKEQSLNGRLEFLEKSPHPDFHAEAQALEDDYDEIGRLAEQTFADPLRTIPRPTS